MPTLGPGNTGSQLVLDGSQTLEPSTGDVLSPVLDKLQLIINRLGDMQTLQTALPPESIDGLNALVDLAATLGSEGVLGAVEDLPATLATIYRGNVLPFQLSSYAQSVIANALLRAQQGGPGYLPMIVDNTYGLPAVRGRVEDIGLYTEGYYYDGADLAEGAINQIRDAIYAYEFGPADSHGDVGNQSLLSWLIAILSNYQGLGGGEGWALPWTPWYRYVSSSAQNILFTQWPWDWTTGEDYPLDPDFSQLQRGDTCLAFLTRVLPSFAWTDVGPYALTAGRGIAWAPLYGGSDEWVRFTLTDQQLAQLWPTAVAPIWPGEDGVVMGEPVEFESLIALPGPMDGIRLEITSVPSGTGEYTNGGLVRYLKLGWLAYVNDAGDIEPHQPLEYQSSIMVPKTMAHAQSVTIWCRPGTTGVATPWNLT